VWSNLNSTSIAIISYIEIQVKRWELQRKPIRWLFSSLGVPDNSLDGRFMKRAG
jgi:hypothetical protein